MKPSYITYDVDDDNDNDDEDDDDNNDDEHNDFQWKLTLTWSSPFPWSKKMTTNRVQVILKEQTWPSPQPSNLRRT